MVLSDGLLSENLFSTAPNAVLQSPIMECRKSSFAHAIEFDSSICSVPSRRIAEGEGNDAGIMTRPLRCPKCRHGMVAVEVAGFEVDRCGHCEGLWFDAGELDWLAQSEVAEVVDTGEVSTGSAMNAVTEIDCPRCSRPMKHVADEHKPEIRYEVCVYCEGAFLDAGEFSDLARLSVAEILQALFASALGKSTR